MTAAINKFFAVAALAAIAFLSTTAARADVVARTVTANPDGTTSYSKTTTSDTTIVTPVGSDDMYVTSDDPVYPVTSSTTTTTYVNGSPVKTTYSREVNHPQDEYQDYYVKTSPSAKTYAVGVDENGNTTQRYENVTVDHYNN